MNDGFWGSGPGADRAPHHRLIGRLSLVISCICSVHSLGVSLGQKLQVSISSLTHKRRSGVPTKVVEAEGASTVWTFHSVLSRAPARHVNLLNKLFNGKGVICDIFVSCWQM